MNGILMFLAFFCGWFFSQFFKIVIDIICGRVKLRLSDILRTFTKSGGMPSGHTASFMALSVVIYFLEGFNSPVFVLSVCTMVIIIYDAINVRYAVGEQGKAINKFCDSEVKIVEGHTLLQVVCGAILGAIIGILVALCAGITNF